MLEELELLQLYDTCTIPAAVVVWCSKYVLDRISSSLYSDGTIEIHSTLTVLYIYIYLRRYIIKQLERDELYIYIYIYTGYMSSHIF